MKGIKYNVADQCMYNLKTWDRQGRPVPAKKATVFMTNADGISENLQKRCDGSHEHQPLLGGRAAAAARYPEELCEAIVEGLIRQMECDKMGVKKLITVERLCRVTMARKDTEHEKPLDELHLMMCQGKRLILQGLERQGNRRCSTSTIRKSGGG